MADLINTYIIEKIEGNTKVFYSGSELWECLCNEYLQHVPQQH